MLPHLPQLKSAPCLHLSLEGHKPIPQQRPRFTTVSKFTLSYDPQKKQKIAVRDLIRSQLPMGFDLIHSAVVVQIVFTFGYPKSWTKKQLAQVQAMPWHTSKPDLDNLEKFYLDCLTGCVFADDCIVCSMQSKKIWGERSSVNLKIQIL